MTPEQFPWERERDEEPARAAAVAGADALRYCPTCGTSHPAQRIEQDGETTYAVDCPQR